MRYKQDFRVRLDRWLCSAERNIIFIRIVGAVLCVTKDFLLCRSEAQTKCLVLKKYTYTASTAVHCFLKYSEEF